MALAVLKRTGWLGLLLALAIHTRADGQEDPQPALSLGPAIAAAYLECDTGESSGCDAHCERTGCFAPGCNCPTCQNQATAQQATSVSLLNPTNRLSITAGVDTLAVFSTKRPFPSGLPLFLLPDSPFGLDTNSFDAHARQSYFGALFNGPKLGGFQTSGQFLTFFQNDNLSADDYGLLVYYAFGEIKNDRWRFSAGLQQDVFNPVSPTVVYLTKLYASGNTGSYRGQLRAERFFQDGDAFGATVQVALSEPLSTLVASNVTRITEDNGWPNIESRVELGFGQRGDIRGSQIRPLEIGVSGVVGQFRTTRTLLGLPSSLPPRAVIDTWGIGSDVQWWVSDCWGTRGEFYYGQGLGEYNGGILQSFNSVTLNDVQSSGGFGEVFGYLTDTFHVHCGYGIDNPRDSDLADTQIRRNQTYFCNLVWDLSKVVQLGLQIDYRKTDYTEFEPDAFLDSDAVIIASRFLWRF